MSITKMSTPKYFKDFTKSFYVFEYNSGFGFHYKICQKKMSEKKYQEFVMKSTNNVARFG